VPGDQRHHRAEDARDRATRRARSRAGLRVGGTAAASPTACAEAAANC